MDITAHDPPAVNQGGQGSCTAASLITGLRHARRTMGAPDIPLAWSTVYGPNNGGRDAGSAIDTSVTHLMQIGVCPVELHDEAYIDPFDWRGYYNGSWPADWKEQARQFRLLEAWDCPSFDHVLSGLYHGFPSVIGVFWPGGGGHAILIVGYDKTKRRVRLLNTWSPAWGERGYGWLDETVCQRGVPYFGGFILRQPTYSDWDPDPPPPIA